MFSISKLLVGILIAPLFMALVVFPVCAEEQAQVSDDTVALINGTPITRAELDSTVKRMQPALNKGGTPASGPELSKINRSVLDKLVITEVLYQESQKQGIKVNQEAVDEQVANIKQRFPSEAEFGEMLSSVGLSEDAMKAQLQREMAIQELIDKQVVQKIVISENAVKEYYDSKVDMFKQPEQVKASHILIKVEPEADDSQKAEARKKLEGIQKKLEAGEAFDALAKEFSQCPSSAKGGDLGFFGTGQMVKPFEEAAFALQPGETSDIVETQFGYHIIKATDKRQAGTMPYEEVKGKLEQFLKQGKTRQQVNSYVEDLRASATVEILLEDESSEEAVSDSVEE